MVVTLRYSGNQHVNSDIAMCERRWGGELWVFQTVAWEKELYISVKS